MTLEAGDRVIWYRTKRGSPGTHVLVAATFLYYGRTRERAVIQLVDPMGQLVERNVRIDVIERPRAPTNGRLTRSE